MRTHSTYLHKLVCSERADGQIPKLQSDVPASGRRTARSDMTRSVETFCGSCEQCNTRRDPVPRARVTMGELYVAEPFETVCIDILSGLPANARGNKHLLVVCDAFTRWCETYPLPDMKATTVATTLVNEFFARYGCPRRLHSDGAANFTGAVLAETCRLLGIEKSKISSYHPEGAAS